MQHSIYICIVSFNLISLLNLTQQKLILGGKEEGVGGFVYL